MNKIKDIGNKKKNAIILMIFLYLKYIISCTSLFVFYKYTNIITIILTVIMMLIILKINKCRINYKLIITFLFIFSIYLINSLFVEYKIIILNWWIEFLSYNLIIMYAINRGIDYDYIMKIWYKIAIYTSSMTIISYILGTISYAGYMFVGIYMSYNFMILYYVLLNDKQNKIKNFFFISVTFIILMLEGNKGSLITAGAGFIVLSYSYTRHKCLAVIGGTFIGTVVLFNIKSIFEVVLKITDMMNISTVSVSRWLYFLEKGFRGGSAGRDILYSDAVDIIRNSGGMPRGVGYYESITGWEYPHNLFLDIFIVLGPILGIIFIFWILYRSFRIIKRNKNINAPKVMFFKMMFCYFVMRTLTSSTFIKERSFWIIVFMIIFESYKIIVHDKKVIVSTIRQ